MTTTLVEKVRWPVDSAGSLMLQFETYGKVIKDIAAAVRSLFASGEQGVWYDPSDIAVTTINKESVSAAISQATVNTEPALTLFKNTLVDGRPLGDIDGNGSVNSADALAYSKYVQGTPNFAALLYIENVMHPYMVRNASTYAAYLTVAGGTLYQDAAGTTPVTAVEQPVGLMLDKSKGLVLGPELVVNGDFSNGTTGWTLGTGWSISSGAAVGTNATGNLLQSNVALSPVGKTYRVTLTISNRTTGSIVPQIGGSTISLSAVGTYTFYLRPSLNDHVLYIPGADFTGSIDNISVRELPGNHAYHTTSVNRPVLSARYNLLTKTEQFDDAVWTKTNATVTPNAVVAPDGDLTAYLLIETTATSQHLLRRTNTPTLTAGATYAYSVFAKSGNRNLALQLFRDASAAQAIFNLSTGAVHSISTGTASIQAVGNGWYRCSVVGTVSAGASTASFVDISILDGSFNFSYTGDGTSGIYIWGADLRVSNDGINLPPYQRVNTATDYDTAGFPHYLRFDGVDDFLVTNSIDFTATDKMSVFAGVRKIGTAEDQIVAQFGIHTDHGVFVVAAPAAATSNSYGFYPRGTIVVGVTKGGYPAPITNVLACLGDISGDSAILRVNGTQAAISTADQGTGNYGNYPLYIGARAGASLWFNGRIYSLIARGAQSTEQQIIDAERYINEKTRAY